MKPRIRALAVAVLALTALLSTDCCAAFPNPDYYEVYALQQGYYGGGAAWFTCTSTNNMQWLTTVRWTDFWSPWFPCKPDLAPRLSAALDTQPKVARPVYVVTNSNQPPVFDTRPGADDYSGLWQVYLVTWLPGSQRGFTDSSPVSGTNPCGLPDASEAEIAETCVVVDCPILALGRLGGPWRNAPTGGYRMAQGLDADVSSLPKWVLLPQYAMQVVNVATNLPMTADVAITEASDGGLARLLGANHAPRLGLMPADATQNLWLMNGPKPAGQLPMIEEAFCTDGRNSNMDYTPIADVVTLDRHIPAYVTVGSGRLFRQLLTNGLLTPAGTDGVVNAHVGYVW